MKRVCKKCNVEKEIEEFKTKWSCKQCVKLARKRYDRFQCENLTDSYIKKFLKKAFPFIKTEEITPKMIQMKREQLLFIRSLRRVKHEWNNQRNQGIEAITR